MRRNLSHFPSRIRSLVRVSFALVFVLTALWGPAAVAWSGGWLENQFTLFESGQVRPLALSEDGKYLYAVNTPDNRLEIFRVKNSNDKPLKFVGSVQVGLEPVAVASADDDQVWVVNHLSDSVSIVDVSNPKKARVVRTLQVGDEPRDIVFAGEDRERAFITTAHRGQNHPQDPQLTTPGVGRADVWVFDSDELDDLGDDDDDDQGGGPLTIVTLFTDTPRALAVSPDGKTVYAAGFMTGNQTTIIHDTLVTNGGENAPDGFGSPAPTTNFQGIPAPESGLIVKYDGEEWVGPAGRAWSDKVRFNLPDYDVFAIDADADPPVQVAGPGSAFAQVGTVLFNMAVNPVNGKIYVSNTEARNEVRFEGPGIFGGTTVLGRNHLNRITVLDGTDVLPRMLNKHIDFSTCCAPLPNSENDRSLAQPTGMEVSADGKTLYVAAFGSGKVGIFATSKLEDDSFVPDDNNHVELTGGGPTGLVLDEARGRLYVMTRFDNGISVVDTAGRTETAHLTLFNPEPADVVEGRPFLYDARLTSSRGNSSCASCHVFGDLDGLAWDLGDPDATILPFTGPFIFPTPPSPLANFHPMKGPMTTQSLRGMDNHGPMHWRGDRNGANDVASSFQPDTGLFDEQAAFEKFNVAFPGLVGLDQEIPEDDMAAFGRFVLQIVYPPNPLRNLDNSLTPSQARGRDHYFLLGTVQGGNGCNNCHVLDPGGNAEFGVERPGFFGSNGLGLVEGTDFPPFPGDLQHFKIPHARNLYQKVGMFGLPRTPDVVPHTDPAHQGDQIRGFGFTHDGSFDTLFRFMLITSFSNVAPATPLGFPFGPEGDPLRRDVEQFLLAFDSNLAPIVGQQLTIGESPDAAAMQRLNLMTARASTTSPECEVVVTTRRGALERRFLFIPGSAAWLPNENGATPLSTQALLDLADRAELTFTCVPPGSGYRMGLDADLDGCFDLTEMDAGTDPRNPAAGPSPCQ
ncbi:MAG: beta-propeller fold lactonase family protein [Acidobacteriota bacterium]|nr:beta-propeller fold lactonase family protein [Acidobacteriota bacterium]